MQDNPGGICIKGVVDAYAALNAAGAILHLMVRKGWVTEDVMASERYFPQGGLRLAQEEMEKARVALANVLKGDDRAGHH